MTNDIEFLRNEIARLRTEQILEQNPIRKLSIQKHIDETLIILNSAENINTDRKEQNNSTTKSKIHSMHHTAAEPTNNKPPTSGQNIKPSNLLVRPIGYVWFTALATVLAAMIIYLIYKHFGISL